MTGMSPPWRLLCLLRCAVQTNGLPLLRGLFNSLRLFPCEALHGKVVEGVLCTARKQNALSTPAHIGHIYNTGWTRLPVAHLSVVHEGGYHTAGAALASLQREVESITPRPRPSPSVSPSPCSGPLPHAGGLSLAMTSWTCTHYTQEHHTPANLQHFTGIVHCRTL